MLICLIAIPQLVCLSDFEVNSLVFATKLQYQSSKSSRYVFQDTLQVSICSLICVITLSSWAIANNNKFHSFTFRFGVPFSFLYCTTYIQDVWREGDEKLFLEQRRAWRDFFGLIDTIVNESKHRLNIQAEEHGGTSPRGLLQKYDSLDVKTCWNSKVTCAFRSIDQAPRSIQKLACKYIARPIASITNAPSPHEKAQQTTQASN